ncbi:MAG TPA: extracellular solute-binding protein [Planctomycetota bacterium]|nr:extracellular solute-binding protein [Planctomycetota bacterium]
MHPTITCSLLLPLLAGCGAEAKTAGPMVYVALDEHFSRPVLEGFGKQLGIEVRQRHDSEANKTVGLVTMLHEEQSHPRCSVFWNNELAHTVRLAQQGLLEPYDSPAARDIPAAFRDPQHRWTAFAARARVLIVNTELLPDEAQWPSSYKDLVDPRWKGRCAIAKPLTGTTLTHFTALRLLLGEQEFTKWLDGMVANEVLFLGGNGPTTSATRAGRVAWAFTDTDDYNEAKQSGFPVACVFPDQQQGGIGTMLIPNSVALVKGGPDPTESKRLIDKILARETEALLAAAASAQIPLRSGIVGPADPSIHAFGTFHAMAWDPEATASNLEGCLRDFGKRFGM